MNKRAVVTISGQVQGVNFRRFTKQTADRLGILGWAKNTAEGTVELVAEGEENDLREFLAELSGGHPYARVEKMDKQFEPATGEFQKFTIIY